MLHRIKRLVGKKVKGFRKRHPRLWSPASKVWRSVWPLYETVRTAIAWPHEHRLYDPVRRRLLEDQKVLIIGSGPSASELGHIPADCKILTCKRALKLFSDKKLDRKVDLYLCCKGAMKRNPVTLDLLADVRTEVLVMDDLDYTRRIKKLRDAYSTLIPDDGKDNFYFRRLLSRSALRRFRAQTRSRPEKSLHHVSSGLRLLQYALYFGAREIYLIGIDLNDNGYFWGENKKQKHLAVDHYFLEQVSKKYGNIFSLSKTSPITRYIPYRDPMDAAGHVAVS